jgi:hypothetical protein
LKKMSSVHLPISLLGHWFFGELSLLSCLCILIINLLSHV